ncbi:MAG: hypothetical protein ABIJ82_02680 [Patescibacteria group bacterium]
MTNSIENLDSFKDSAGRINEPFAETIAYKQKDEGMDSALETEKKMQKTVEGRTESEKTLRGVVCEKYPHVGREMRVDVQGDVYVILPEYDKKDHLVEGKRFIYAGAGFYEIGGNNVALGSLDPDKLIPYILANVTTGKEHDIPSVDALREATGLEKLKQVMLSTSIYARKLDYSPHSKDTPLINQSFTEAEEWGKISESRKFAAEIDAQPEEIKERI